MRRLITTRTVDNPSYTDGLKYAEREKAKPRRGTLVFTTEGPKQEMARVKVEENIITRLGALCFIRKREKHHELAAEQFKSLYEARYGHGNPSIDPARIQVDTSKVAHDNGMAAMLDRTGQLDIARAGLTTEAFDRLVTVIILEIPAGDGLHWRDRSAMVDLVLADLDLLGVLWKLRSKGERIDPGIPSRETEGGETNAAAIG